MAFNERSLDDYVDVAQRLADFRTLYPEGCLQPANLEKPWELANVTGYDKNGEVVTQSFIVYTAAAYRWEQDGRPGIGIAWEVFPGRTPYTRGSELMNAETSAWGRAVIAVLASDSKSGGASRQEVKARRAERDDGLPTNADGSLSRSRTSDEEKAAAGVMTAAGLAEHTALGGGHPNERKTPAAERGKVRRMTNEPTGPRLTTAEVLDPWQDQPAGEIELQPGTIAPDQQAKIHAAFKDLDRAARLATISDITGRHVTSSNELSYTEAARVLAKLSGART